MSELRIRNINEADKKRLIEISQQLNYPSVNQFLLSQLMNISKNGAIDIFQNEFSEELEKIKIKENKIISNLNRQELVEIQIIEKLNEIDSLVTNWIQYLDATEAGQI